MILTDFLPQFYQGRCFFWKTRRSSSCSGKKGVYEEIKFTSTSGESTKSVSVQTHGGQWSGIRNVSPSEQKVQA
ncbi:hypothetical protein AVEN_144750-1 [Araneus ventricosus]|uniref:Uncharacterized protein n=1 Tax=Araneus ventricosus TaxID=182803 RepID=A0A4Y2TEA6_ARAVE|nr:hypothetical protein AVEN_144750-1 [Araneus ventricosus]